MKCQYCGSNLGLDNEVCPFCGRENIKAKKYVENKKGYQKELADTEQKVKKQVKINARAGRMIFIALMVLIVGILWTINSKFDDAGFRIERREQNLEETVERNIDSIAANLQEMERNREYLEMSYYVLNYSLRGHREFDDYSRVFSALGSYETIFEGILNIASDFDFYGEKQMTDWCDMLANSIATWNLYVDGEFWKDVPDSPMHAGEHGAFLADIKVDVKDMVQVYFGLTDEQADAMWTMDKEELSRLLYDQYTSMDPEVSGNE